MRVAVTGANGFVGTTLVRQLLGEHDVLAIDSLRYGPWRFAADELEFMETSTIDLRDSDACEDVINRFRPDAVIHLAAIHFIPECELDPSLAVSTNVQATVNLARCCPPGARFVLASSGAVYSPKVGPHDETFDETTPSDVYGYTKLHAEQLLTYFAIKRGFEAVLIRLFNVIGPGETNPHLLPEIIHQLQSGSEPIRLGNTHPKRDYVFVDDVAAGFAAAATGTFPAGEQVVTANLGSGISHSVDDVIATLGELRGRAIAVEVDPDRVRPVDRPDLCAGLGRLKTWFGWEPRVPFAEALRRTSERPEIARDPAQIFATTSGSKS
jgi:UDP-glucose 4-epimerase